MATQMHDVTSSNVAQVGHDGASLFVTFNNGSQYKYHGVPENELMNILGAPSVGKYLNQVIKPTYPAERLG